MKLRKHMFALIRHPFAELRACAKKSERRVGFADRPEEPAP